VNNLLVIIISIRPNELINKIKFYKFKSILKNFLIVDGYKNKNKFVSKKVGYYYHKPKLSLFERYFFSLEKLKKLTSYNYCLFIGDDDYLHIQNTKKILQNLKKNSNILCSRGETYSYRKINNFVYYKKKASVRRFLFSGIKNLTSFNKKRQILLTQSIFKKNFYLNAHNFLKTNTKNNDYFYFYEKFFTTCALLLGKVDADSRMQYLRATKNTKPRNIHKYEYLKLNLKHYLIFKKLIEKFCKTKLNDNDLGTLYFRDIKLKNLYLIYKNKNFYKNKNLRIFVIVIKVLSQRIFLIYKNKFQRFVDKIKKIKDPNQKYISKDPNQKYISRINLMR
jgi:hypothetical protein